MQVEKSVRLFSLGRIKRTARMHELKCDTIHFNELWNDNKKSELRKNDRKFRKGDVIRIYEIRRGKETGRNIVYHITHLLKDFEGIKKGYCILSLYKISSSDDLETDGRSKFERCIENAFDVIGIKFKKHDMSVRWNDERGRKRQTIKCPFCGKFTNVFIYSFVASGKKCKCGVHHASNGYSYKKTKAVKSGQQRKRVIEG